MVSFKLLIVPCLFVNELAVHGVERKRKTEIDDSVCYCGERMPLDDDEENNLEDESEIVPSDRVVEGVTGGEITTRDKFPWSIRIVFVCLGKNRKLAKWTVCTGSILSPRFVASSAHCFKESVDDIQFDSFCKRQKNRKYVFSFHEIIL